MADTLSPSETIPKTRNDKNISHEPPITKTILSQLDIKLIYTSPEIRHRLNFDPDLRVCPNLDGESGRRNLEKAAEFWDLLRIELTEFVSDPTSFEHKLVDNNWTLPSLLATIKEILGTIIPSGDWAAVEETFNTQPLMQKLKTFDLEDLGNWIERTLMFHCAPMRDEWVNETATLLIEGGRDRDVMKLVQSMQSLLGVFEAMKLDLANHFIRHKTPDLIKGTVEFEQDFFARKISKGEVDIGKARTWFENAKSNCHIDSPQANFSPDILALLSAVVDMLVPSREEPYIPDTFWLDKAAIMELRANFGNLVGLEVCRRLLERFANPLLISSFSTSKAIVPAMSISIFDAERDKGREIGADEVDNTEDGNSEIEEDQDSQIDGDDSPVSENDRYSNPQEDVTSTSTAHSVMGPWTPELQQSIFAIFEDKSNLQSWQQSISIIAHSMLGPNPNQENISKLESQLKLHLRNPLSPILQSSVSYLSVELCALLSELAVHYAPLTAIQLFKIFTSKPEFSQQVQYSRQVLNSVAKKAGHVVFLHNAVWTKEFYNVKPGDVSYATSAEGQEPDISATSFLVEENPGNSLELGGTKDFCFEDCEEGWLLYNVSPPNPEFNSP